LESARQHAALGKVHVFRAGIWKPRTKPGSFEGVGEEGLVWLEEVKKISGLLTATEIATPKHVELCMKHDIDMLWIGARTTVNPFSIQEIAQALKGTEIPILIKNPVNPDIKLWSGVIERIHSKGVKNIIAVHRGFYSFEKTIFRNAPLWEIPIELKRIFPTLPIICDPSHISGKRDLLLMVAQQALNLDMDGLMIESHPYPDKAFTDASQQITPANLNKLLGKLILRKAFEKDEEITGYLEKLRSQIDIIDKELLGILSERFKIVNEIGEYKKQNDITILQIKRWSHIMNERLKFGKKINIDEAFLTKLLKLVHKESIRIQTEIMNKEKKQAYYDREEKE
jgi:chorismate mutase